jgi:arabinofuranosyltransferase
LKPVLDSSRPDLRALPHVPGAALTAPGAHEGTLSQRLEPTDPTTAQFLVLLSAGLFLIVLIRTGWVADDAYITFRTIDNWFSGFGLRWNVVERVQTYTHPLWLLILSGAYRVTGELYFTTLVVSMAMSLLVVVVLVTRVASSSLMALLGLTTLTLSKSYVDFSTSGLENPLTHLLLIAFLVVYWAEPARRTQVVTLSLLTALLMLTRPDGVLLVGPTLLVAVLRQGWRRSGPGLMLGFLPVVLWEGFALVYYGFPLPNSYYAKLGPGIPPGLRASQGFLYLLDAVMHDPLLLLTIFVALILTATRQGRRSWPIALGIVIYLASVVRMGGDFMAGRFLTAPFLCSVALLVRRPLLRDQRLALPAFALVLLVGHLSSQPVLLNLTSGFGSAPEAALAPSGISDERMLYYQSTGLLLARNGRLVPDHPWARNGREHRDKGTRVIVKSTMGFRGFTAGPHVHVVDDLGVTDPLIARLPPKYPTFQPGHIPREVPAGYVETIDTGQNVLRNPGIAAYYERLKLITQGPVWNLRRFRTIVAMNLGRYDYLLRFDERAVP